MAKKKRKKSKKESKKIRVAKQEVIGEPAIKDKVEIPGIDKPKAEMKVQLERELRRYVKKAGGLRKGLAPADVDRAKKIMKKLGRTYAAWDERIHVPGMDNPTVRGMVTEPVVK